MLTTVSTALGPVSGALGYTVSTPHLGSGEELIITQDEKPVAKLVRENSVPRKARKAGNCIGLIKIVADDDEHLKDFAEYM